MLNKFEKLHIDLNNICELNHFVYTHSAKENLVGQEYDTLYFHAKEIDAQKYPWVYRINKYGYRGNNWNFDKNAIAFFGCSITFGIGVEVDIASKIEELLNINSINLGQPGASAINVLKTFINFIKYHPVDTAIITLPAIDRIYYPSYHERASRWSYSNFIPHWISPEQEEIHTYAYKFFNTDTNAAYLYDYIEMAKLTAKMSDTKIIWSSWDENTKYFLKSVVDPTTMIHVGNLILDKARDDLHPGPMFVQDWASNIVRKLKEDS
jgi:hypothetical protein